MNDKKLALLLKIREAQFSMLECGLFLDTHPDDKEAEKRFEALRKSFVNLTKEYEKEYGALTLSGDFGNLDFDWINDPWPWEKEAN